MISINSIEKYQRFPIIDFKFNNTGTGKAFLWEFIVNVLEVEIDLQPVFEYSYHFDSSTNNLEIYVQNNGHGPAKKCHFEINNPLLNQCFSLDERTFNGDIVSGLKKCILVLNNSSSINKEVQGKIGALKIGYSCVDNNNKPIKDSNSLYCGNEYEIISMTNKGFKIEQTFYAPPLACMRRPSEIYTTIISPEMGKHKRTYKISREVAPGDTERFHIMVGCKKSAKLKMEFHFKVDKNSIITSRQFEIEIHNPLNSRFYDDYLDGEILKADINNFNSENKMSEWEKEYRLEELKRQDSKIKKSKTYPFFDTDFEDEF